MELFKAELNSKKGIEFQQNLFDLFESFPIFYYNADLNEAERILDKIEKLLMSKENTKTLIRDLSEEIEKRYDFNKMKMMKGDLLMCQKKYDLAEKEYLSCDVTHHTISYQKHKDVRLTILYKLIVNGMNSGENLKEYNLKLQNSFLNVRSEPEFDQEEEVYTKSNYLIGFKNMMDKLIGRTSTLSKYGFEDFVKLITRQTKNREILKNIDLFFKALKGDQLQSDESLLYCEIASFLVCNVETEIASIDVPPTRKIKRKEKNYEIKFN